MDLLDFARGPAMQAAMTIFVFGVVWRLVSLYLLPTARDRSPASPARRYALIAAVREITLRSWPLKPIGGGALFATINGYLFHLGLAVTILFLAPHILFFKNLFGFGWPSLPNNVIFAIAVLTVGGLLAALVRRVWNPVERFISTFDDYFTWFVTVLPMVTGLAATGHLFLRYETMLAIHILSVALLLIWFPFGKLMHAFYLFLARGTTGVLLTHRGTQH